VYTASLQGCAVGENRFDFLFLSKGIFQKLHETTVAVFTETRQANIETKED